MERVGVKKRGDVRRQYLEHERLKRESEMATRNNERLRRAWLKIMTRVRMPGMRVDGEVARNTFDRSLDIKDHRASLLVESFDEAEEQYQRSIGSHIETIGRLEGIYRKRLEDGHQRYEQRLREMTEEAEADVDRIVTVNDESEALLGSIVVRGRRDIGELLERIQSETAYELDNMRQDGSHAIRMALLDLENKIRFYWTTLDTTISSYLNGTRQRRMSYEALKARDARDREIIARQLEETAELADAIEKLRESTKKLQDSCSDTVTSINVERALFADAYSSARQRFHNGQRTDKAQLTHMTKEFNVALKNLRRSARKARAVLSFVRMCRKLEARVGKPLPAPCEPVVNDETFGCLDFFWRRVGVIEVETMQLVEERRSLRSDNECLKKCIRAAISGTRSDSEDSGFESVI